MIKVYKFIFVFLLYTLGTSVIFAQAKAPAVSGKKITADLIRAKAYLEEVMAIRYTQEINTLIDKGSFTVGAQLDLEEIEPENLPAVDDSAEPLDLTVGHLDTEKLIESFGLPNEKAALLSFLATQRIKTVLLSVGIKKELGEDTKKEITEKLSKRLVAEFGSNGQVNVSYLKDNPLILSADSAPKSLWDMVGRFQSFSSTLLLALILFLSVVFWRLTTSKQLLSKNGSAEQSGQMKISLDGQTHATGSAGTGSGYSHGQMDINSQSTTEPRPDYSAKISEVAPQIEKMLPDLIQIWNAAGEEGQNKIVCFAECAGKTLGRLPIPEDSIQDIAKIFNSMPNYKPEDKKKLIEKTYWDLMAVYNLGVEALSQPFSYLTSFDGATINNLLLEKNMKSKLMVTKFLPTDVQKKYFSQLNEADKFELIKTSLETDKVTRTELKNVEDDLKRGLGDDKSADNVSFENIFEDLVCYLKPLEEIEYLARLNTNSLTAYKKKNVYLAFLPEWSDEALSRVISKARNDQLVAYLRTVDSMKERVIGLCSPMTAEVLQDDLAQADQMSLNDKNILLQEFKAVLEDLVKFKEIDLEQQFESVNSDSNDNVVPIKSA